MTKTMHTQKRVAGTPVNFLFTRFAPKRILLSLFILSLFWGTTHAQTILQQGDIAIVGLTANVGSGTDRISFVCFKDITTGTVIDMAENWRHHSCRHHDHL